MLRAARHRAVITFNSPLGMEPLILSDIRKKLDNLTRERDYYREQVHRLDREVLRLQEEMGEVRHKAGRCRMVAGLIGKLYGALQPQISNEEIGSVFLRLLT